MPTALADVRSSITPTSIRKLPVKLLDCKEEFDSPTKKYKVSQGAIRGLYLETP